MSQGSGRYQRSAAGMVGAMIVTLVVIGVFVAFRAINRDPLVVHRDAVDYLETVEALQQGDSIDPAYPPRLPKGWIATRAVFSPENLAWELDLLTADGRYVGLRQASMTDRALIEEYVDDSGRPGADVTLDGRIAEWRAWSVDGDDHAFTAESGKTHLLVFGAAPEQQVEDLAASLVVD